MGLAAETLPATKFTGRFNGTGFLLGFALGGFFYGILPHQILQWHHLLSGLQGDQFRDLRVQVLADGGFHALMYVIAGAGLWMLWRSRREHGRPGATRRLAGFGLVGFGVWHIADSVLSHWITGIHRIKMDADNPLLWDLVWFAAFGIGPLLTGLALINRRRPDERGGGDRGRTAPALMALAVLVAAPAASLPPAGVSTVMVLFGPGMSAMEAIPAAEAIDAKVAWSDRSGQVWAFDLGENVGRWREFYRPRRLAGE